MLIMSDGDIIIRAENLSKVYRLYAKPHYRFLDMFGLLREGAGKYTEHAALSNINLEFRRGEKVAIIGRNGAGKSTLLKTVTRVIKPTTGSIEIAGKVHALLQIGTGFHPDFTGRENVYSYLAHMGIRGGDAHEKFNAITEFAELEEYIDQPVKTYSTGMGVRLMFATSTVIDPDILVLDEVLGVGDAYFSQKSFERINELCAKHSTTLLLVTHDVYSAVKLCDRFIWLDRGIVKQDAPSSIAVKAYEQSIRDQEEHRLNLKRVTSLLRNRAKDSARNIIFGAIRRNPFSSADSRIWISAIRIFSGGREVAALTVDAIADDLRSGLIVDPKEGNWGEIDSIDNKAAREFLNHGSIFHRLPFVFVVEDGDRLLTEVPFEVGVDYFSETPTILDFECSAPGNARRFGATSNIPSPGWGSVRIILSPMEGGEERESPLPGSLVRYGSRRIEIESMSFLDGNGVECHQFRTGGEFRARFNYRINDPAFRESPVLVLAFQKDGTIRSHRFWTDQFDLDAGSRNVGGIEVVASPLLLAAGTYLVTASIYRAGNFGTLDSKKFFTASDGLYDMHTRAYEIVVFEGEPHPLNENIIFIHPARWTLSNQE